MKSKAQKREEAIARNWNHISHYIDQALALPPAKQGQGVKNLSFIKQKLGIPKTNASFDAAIEKLLNEAKEAA